MGLSPQDRKAIHFVSIDMWAPYHQAARNKLPDAQVVVDRFHVMKQLNTRLTQLRTEHQKGLSPEMRAEIKGSRWILVRNRSELSPLEEEKLQKALELFPELRTLYLLKEEFRSIFDRSLADGMEFWCRINKLDTIICKTLLELSSKAKFFQQVKAYDYRKDGVRSI